MNTLLGLALTITMLISCKKHQLDDTANPTDNPNFKKEQQDLIVLKHEIDQLSQSITCTDSADWKITPLGSKACGGPAGFVSYSIKVQEKHFLEKVALYTKNEDAFNRKWNIMSDCSTPVQPKKVICKNGLAVMIY